MLTANQSRESTCGRPSKRRPPTPSLHPLATAAGTHSAEKSPRVFARYGSGR